MFCWFVLASNKNLVTLPSLHISVYTLCRMPSVCFGFAFEYSLFSSETAYYGQDERSYHEEQQLCLFDPYKECLSKENRRMFTCTSKHRLELSPVFIGLQMLHNFYCVSAKGYDVCFLFFFLKGSPSLCCFVQGVQSCNI